MKDMGLMNNFPGLGVWHGDGLISIEQGKYTFQILQKFHMQDCKPMDTPLHTNWRKDDASTGEAVDGNIYRVCWWGL